MKAFADVADARVLLRTCSTGQLVLTDPPHLDWYASAEEHLEFTRSWLPLALKYTKLVHTCGSNPGELTNYLQVATPDIVWVWPQTEGYHLVLGYGVDEPASSVVKVEKPYGYVTWIAQGDWVLDPFCGRGDTWKAAMAAGAEWWVGGDTYERSVDYVNGLINDIEPQP